MNNVWYLEQVNLYNLLCPHKMESAYAGHTYNSYQKNDFIYLEEDESRKVYLIAQGKVKIGYYTEEGKEVVKAILSKGEIFGEMALLGEEFREEFARAIDNDTSVCVMTIPMMMEMLQENKNFSLRIYKLIGYRIRKLERRLDQLLFKDARTRLVDFLGELAEESGRIRQGKVIIEHPYTQKDMADLIGTSRPTLNLLLNELSHEKRINFSRKRILLEDPNYFLTTPID